MARKCELKEIKYIQAKNFIEDNHIQGSISSSINIGLFYKDELVSVGTFGKSRFNKNYEYELLRFCSKKGINVIGGFGKILNYFIKTYSRSLITYADKRYSNGNLYLKIGFKLINESAPNYFYTETYNTLESRVKFQKHKLEEILDFFDENLTEWENMKANGYDRIWDCENFVFSL